MKAKYPSQEPEYQRAYRQRTDTPEKRAAKSAASKAWYAQNKERAAARMREHYRKNKAKYIAKAKEWAAKNREQALANRRAWYHHPNGVRKAKHVVFAKKRKESGKAAAYRERVRQRQRDWARKRSADVTDDYAREMLSKYSPISTKDWPQSLVDLKKQEILCRRAIGDGRTGRKPKYE